MFVSADNSHEVDGRVLHVQTERQTLEDKQIQPIHPVEPFSAFAAKPSPPAWPQNTPPSLSARAAAETFPPPGPMMVSPAMSPNSTKVPWQLDMAAAVPTRRDPNEDAQSTKPRHPGPITLPPFPTLGEINPISPMQTRNLPPMTPSMPGFVFNAYPRTPPIHPHQFLSPGGAGPFSPGQPVTSPVYSGRNPLLNAAPGAPVYRQPGQGGSAALGTPTTQVFPNNSTRPAGGPPGGEVADDYFPPVAEKADDLAGATAALSVHDPPADSAHTSAGPPGGSVPPSVTVTTGSPPPANGRRSLDGGNRRAGA